MRTYDCEQINRATPWAHSNTSTVNGIQLPNLSINDIVKLDQLLLFMKEKKTIHNNIFSFCKERWGDNKLLYLYFAEYLKKNSFTAVQPSTRGIEYAWNQKITHRGLALDSFKKEYHRQLENKKAFLRSQKQLEGRTRFSHNSKLLIRNFILGIMDLKLASRLINSFN